MIQSPLGSSSTPSKPENFVWIIFTPFKITYQSVAAQRGSAMNTVRAGEQIKLLAPDSIMYTHSHSWGEYESMASRLLSKYSEFAKMKNEGNALGSALPNIAKQIGTGATEIAKGNYGDAASQAKGALDSLHGGLSGAAVANVKVDLPLVFQGSERRSFTFEFNLLAISDPKAEVYDIVRNFELYAAAQSKGQVDLDPPYVFNLRTEPGDIINVDKAALESVQPTWKAPYSKEGYPYSCNLTLTFKDMSPLYRRTLEQGGYNVTTSTKGESKPESESKFKISSIKGLGGR